MDVTQWLFVPMAAQALLTLVVLLLLAYRRRMAFNAGEVDKSAMIDDRQWPDHVLKASNNYKSQFEWPVLFFAACAVMLATRSITEYQIILAWAFVASRIWHTVNHVGKNRLPGRFFAFLLGVIIVLVMWIVLTLRIFVIL